MEPDAGLTIWLHALARSTDFYTPEDAPNSGGWIADRIAPELSYAPIVTKRVGLELFGSWGGAFQTPKSQSEDGAVRVSVTSKRAANSQFPFCPCSSWAASRVTEEVQIVRSTG